MTQPRFVRPTYADRFTCIGSACEDTCCQGWSVPIDPETYQKYQQLPASPLRVLLDASIQIASPTAEEPNPPHVASMRMNASNQCPMLTEDRLCRIQIEHGAELLSHTCAHYPRVVHSVDGSQEISLTLSCPEAARLVLLSPNLLEHCLTSNPFELSSTTAIHDDATLHKDFWPIRAVVFSLVRNRIYPLWQRLFLLGLLCRRLDSIAKGELKRPLLNFLADFEAAIASGSLRPAMETLPIDRAAQLDAVLRLAGMMLHRANIHPRFVECVQAFTTGIGNGPGATLESLTAHYATAHDRFYAPFFEHHPHIAENYLVNTILRRQFPFGCDALDNPLPAQISMTDEFAKLTAQFALMKGLLIGVAGFHRERFAPEHVVHTVQAATKHFEHHPEFLDLAHKLLVESQLDGARGVAILLRNAEPLAPRPAVPGIHAPEPQAGTRE